MPINRDIPDLLYTNNESTNLYKPNTSIYDKLDTLSNIDLSGNTSLSSDVALGTNSIYFNPGNIQKAGTVFGTSWSFQGWFKFDTILPLFGINSSLKLQLVLNRTLNKVSLIQSILPGDVIQLDKPLSISNTWNFIRIIRKGSTLSLDINLQPIALWTEFYFPLVTGDLIVGKNVISNIANSFLAQSVLFIDKPDIKDVTSESLDSYRSYYSALQKRVQPVMYLNKDRTNCNIYPSKPRVTYYSIENELYDIAPSTTGISMTTNTRGLTIVKDSGDSCHPLQYRLHTTFYLPNKDNSIIVLSSQHKTDSKNYYIKYDAAINKLYFYYNIHGNPTLQSIELNVDFSNYINIELIVKINSFSILANGVLQGTDTGSLRGPQTLLYSFNYNFKGNTNLNSNIYLYYFCILPINNNDIYGVVDTSLLPYTISTNDYVPISSPFNLHQINSKPIVPTLQIPFSVHGPTSITPSSSNAIVISQSTYSSDVRYTVSIRLPKYVDDIKNNITISYVSPIVEFTNTSSFTLSISALTKNKKITYFDLIVTNNTYTVIKRINIINTAAFVESSIELPGFKESILSSYLLQGWEGNAGTTSSTLTVSLFNGRVYKITQNSEKIVLTTPINEVRTIFYIYQELASVSNRLYVGKSDGYTFNGGPVGEYIGELQVNTNSYVKVNSIVGVYRKPTASKDGNFIVYIDEVNQKVKILQKNGSSWNTSPIELTLNLQVPSLVNNASIDISEDSQHIILGFPEANSGEGVVQIWGKIGTATTWTKTLHLGTSSIASNASSFGQSVAINNNGTSFLASEIGTNNIYYYSYISAWSATPTQIFNYGSSCTSLSMSSTKALICLLDNTARLLTYSTIWSLSDTYTSCLLGIIDKLTDKHIIYRNGLIELFPSNPGVSIFSLAISDVFNLDIYNSNFLLGIPTLSKVQIYKNNSYTSPISLISSLADYGIYSQLSISGVVISDYDTILDVYSSDASSYGEQIQDVHRNGLLVNNQDIMDNKSLAIYCFRTKLPLTLDTIGSGLGSTVGANSINGIFLGAIFYDRLLTLQEIQDMTYNLTRLLNIRETGLADYE